MQIQFGQRVAKVSFVAEASLASDATPGAAETDTNFESISARQKILTRTEPSATTTKKTQTCGDAHSRFQ